MHLVGVTIEIFYDARPYERQISSKSLLHIKNILEMYVHIITV